MRKKSFIPSTNPFILGNHRGTSKKQEERDKVKVRGLYLDAPATKADIQQLRENKADVLIPAFGKGKHTKIRPWNNRKSSPLNRVQMAPSKEYHQIKKQIDHLTNDLFNLEDENSEKATKLVEEIKILENAIYNNKGRIKKSFMNIIIHRREAVNGK